MDTIADSWTQTKYWSNYRLMKCESPFTEAEQDVGFTGSRMQRIQDTEGGMCELLHCSTMIRTGESFMDASLKSFITELYHYSCIFYITIAFLRRSSLQ